MLADGRLTGTGGISIHAPHEGERLLAALVLGVRIWAFQSTLPTRGSDYDMQGNIGQLGKISIHAPHEGERQTPVQNFYST